MHVEELDSPKHGGTEKSDHEAEDNIDRNQHTIRTGEARGRNCGWIFRGRSAPASVRASHLIQGVEKYADAHAGLHGVVVFVEPLDQVVHYQRAKKIADVENRVVELPQRFEMALIVYLCDHLGACVEAHEQQNEVPRQLVDNLYLHLIDFLLLSFGIFS